MRRVSGGGRIFSAAQERERDKTASIYQRGPGVRRRRGSGEMNGGKISSTGDAKM